MFKYLGVSIALYSAVTFSAAEDEYDYFSEPPSTVAISGELIGQFRNFKDHAERDSQSNTNVSLAFEPEFYYEFPDSKDSVIFTPFFRWDEADSERSHGDIRELRFHHVASDWELGVGISSVFWGVTETVHLVNIINQVDGVENLDEEDLLGQPMVNLTLVNDWGNLDFFILPSFRERNFSGRDGRPGTNTVISVDDAIYESGAESKRTDVAVRWSRSVDVWDVGLAYFHGTSREARFSEEAEYGQNSFSLNSYGEVELIPIYDVIDQVSIDVQATFDAWLLKLEAINRSGQGDRFVAAAAGLEYSFYDVAESGIDVGLVVEYLYDEREFKATDDDLSLAIRLAFNDISSTELLAGFARDLQNESLYYFIEGSRRLGDSYKVSLEVRGVSGVENGDPLIALYGDNFAQLELGYYF